MSRIIVRTVESTSVFIMPNVFTASNKSMKVGNHVNRGAIKSRRASVARIANRDPTIDIELML